MLVAFPVAGIRIEFDVAVQRLTLNADRTAGEVGAWAGVPGAEVGDAHRFAIGAGKFTAEGSREPQALQIEFSKWLRKARQPCLLDARKHRIAKACVAISERERRHGITLPSRA